MLEEKKHIFSKISFKTGTLLSRLGLGADFYTLLSLFFALAGFILFIFDHLVPGLILFALAGFLDFVDGAVARAMKMTTARGAYLDTISDRYVEMLAFLSLMTIDIKTIILTQETWIFLVLFGSMMTTYAKSAQVEKGISKTESWRGLLGRPERFALILLALIAAIFYPALAIYPLVILAVLANLTALQRIVLGLRK